MAATISTRTLVLAAAAVTVLVGLQARALPYLPGDIPIAHAFQAATPGTGWVAPMVRTASAPGKYVLVVDARALENAPPVLAPPVPFTVK